MWISPLLFKLNEFINSLDNNFEPIMDYYFSKFKDKMNKRSIIPSQLVEKYKNDVCFLVNTNTTLINEVESRIAWLPLMDYGLDIDWATKSIEALLEELKDKGATRFGTYEEAKTRIKMDLFGENIGRKSEKMISTLEKQFGDVEEQVEKSVEEVTKEKKSVEEDEETKSQVRYKSIGRATKGTKR